MDDAGLDEVPLFASLSAHDRRELAQRIDEIDIGEGERLVRQGEFAYEFFVILEGRAEVTRDGQRVAGLGPGDFLGEMGIVGHTVRNASVTTLTPGPRARDERAGLPRDGALAARRGRPDPGRYRGARPRARRLTACCSGASE